MSGSQSFTVYLTEEASVDDDGDPIRADDIDFYDSGVWVSHAGGRDFFPYERILRIREGTADVADQRAVERRDAASGTAGAIDETQLDVE
jgi:hypothetical protein